LYTTDATTGDLVMNEQSKQQTQNLIDKYFVGQSNNELVINSHNMNNFLREFSELVISRTLDIAFNMKDE
jgi:hypothetical protein